MRTQEILTGIVFVLFLGVGAFFYSNPASFDVAVNRVDEFLFSWSTVPSGIDDNKEREALEGVVREENRIEEGELTRKGIIEETNRRRMRFEDSPLEENYILNEVAETKLDDMFENQYFAHVSPEGVGIGDVAKEMGYEFLLIGDNLAKGNYRDDREVVGDWMDSPGHRKNILDDRYIEIGVATRKGSFEEREVWISVQVFGMPTWACPEVDKALEEQIDTKKARVENLETRKETLKKEIDDTERGSDEHIEKVEEYNRLVEEYNSLISSLKDLVDEYNEQVRIRKECIRG